MSPNTTEHSPHDHNEYYTWPNDCAHFPAVLSESLVSSISPSEIYAHAYFSSGNCHSRMATPFSGEGFKKTLDTKQTPLRVSPAFVTNRIIPPSSQQTVIMYQMLWYRYCRTSIIRTILYGNIYSLSERDIRTAHSHSHSTDDFISPKMKKIIEDIIGEALIEIWSKAQTHLLYLS